MTKLKYLTTHFILKIGQRDNVTVIKPVDVLTIRNVFHSRPLRRGIQIYVPQNTELDQFSRIRYRTNGTGIYYENFGRGGLVVDGTAIAEDGKNSGSSLGSLVITNKDVEHRNRYFLEEAEVLVLPSGVFFVKERYLETPSDTEKLLPKVPPAYNKWKR